MNQYEGKIDDVTGWRVEVNGQRLDPGPSLAIANHSPDGFAWGYSGSGPAQLALAILLHEYGSPSWARTYYQEFKSAKIARFDQDHGWEMTSTEIDGWRVSRMLPRPSALGVHVSHTQAPHD